MQLGLRIVPIAMLVAFVSCGSGSNGTSGNGGAEGGNAGDTMSGGASGSNTGGGTMGGSTTGGNAGSSTGGASGSGVSGSGQSGAGGTAGSAGSSAGGTAGSASGAGGSAGAGSGGRACERDDDCVVAQTYSTTGCCSRGCGVALNGEWVATEPCATADPMTDPVPASCSTGCTLCPQDPRCPVVYDAVCVDGTCTEVTAFGPCAVNDDCVLAIDYESQTGACCSCESVTSRTTMEHAPCIVPASDPEPQGCEPSPPDICATTSCPITCNPPMNLRCDAGRCASG